MYFTILMLFYMVKTNQSFKENCENNIVNLKCKKNDLIITEIHQNGICISCGENVIEKPGHNHVKKKEKELNRLCGKKKLCNFNDNDEKLFKGYKCVFQNQHHVCVPSKLTRQFLEKIKLNLYLIKINRYIIFVEMNLRIISLI